MPRQLIAIVVVPFAVLLTSCSVSQQSSDAAPSNVTTTVAPFLVAVDESGAVLLDPENEQLVGVSRAQRGRPVWRSKVGADRKFAICADTGCPSIIASGAYYVVEGNQPQQAVVRIDATGRLIKTTEIAEYLMHVDDWTYVAYVPNSPKSKSGELLFESGSDASRRVIQMSERPLWFPAPGGNAGLLRTSPHTLLRIAHVSGRWSIRETIYEEPIDVACLDSPNGTVVATSANKLSVNEATVGVLENGDTGGCEVRDRFALITTYSQSSASGPTTSLELWRLEPTAMRLWARDFPSLSRPTLVDNQGRVAVAAAGRLHELDSQGRISTTPDILDVKSAADGSLVLLRADLRVLWRTP